jgi:hypothetical protein
MALSYEEAVRKLEGFLGVPTRANLARHFGGDPNELTPLLKSPAFRSRVESRLRALPPQELIPHLRALANMGLAETAYGQLVEGLRRSPGIPTPAAVARHYRVTLNNVHQWRKTRRPFRSLHNELLTERIQTAEPHEVARAIGFLREPEHVRLALDRLVGHLRQSKGVPHHAALARHFRVSRERINSLRAYPRFRAAHDEVLEQRVREAPAKELPELLDPLAPVRKSRLVWTRILESLRGVRGPLTRKRIAKHFGVPVYRVHNWIYKSRAFRRLFEERGVREPVGRKPRRR